MPKKELGPGVVAPDFNLVAQDGSSLKLSSLRGSVVVLYFYPKDFTSGCTTEACDFRDAHQDFDASDAVVLGVSPDSADRHSKFAADLGLPFKLLADESKETLKAYGVWGLKKNYGREYEGVIRSTFVIDREGRIAKVWRGVKVNGHVDKVLAEVKRLSV